MRLQIVVAALVVGAATAHGQVSPDAHWLTIRSRHFNIRFTPGLEHEARRASVNAERAYSQLAAELVPPKGKIELVVSDNVDFTNGYATIFPYNTIVIFAHPPIDAVSLRNYDDWNQLVVTHELTHIFHLDRARGIYAVGRKVFGRQPTFFPNAMSPSWMTEGLAVYYESRLTGGGRLEGSFHSMVARGAAATGRIPGLADLSRASTRFPGGEIVYVYGSLLFDYLSQTRGPGTIRDFVEASSGALPFFRGRAVKKALGISMESAWKQWTDSLTKTTSRDLHPMAGWRDITPDTRAAFYPRWKADTLLVALTDGRQSLSLFSVSPSGARVNLGRRNAIGGNVALPDGSLIFAQPEYISPYEIRSDLYVQTGGNQTRLTRGARLTMPDVNESGRIVAVQAVPGTTRLVLVSRSGSGIRPLGDNSLTEQWAEPRWSPDGGRIAAIRITRGGMSAVVVLDSLGKIVSETDGVAAVDATPAWSSNGAKIYFSSDREGAPELYEWDVSKKKPHRISAAVTGLLSPEPSPDGKLLASILYTGKGYHLGVAPIDADSSSLKMPAALRRESCPGCVLEGARATPAFEESNAPVERYSAWETLLPRYWEPVFVSSSNDGTEWGLATSGSDVIARHQFDAAATIQTRYHEIAGRFSYRYSGLGLPLVDLSVNQSWDRGYVYSQGSVRPVARLDRRDRTAASRLTFSRPRYRTLALASLGAEIQLRDYATSPDTIFKKLADRYHGTTRLPSLTASATWLNTQRPTLSISREDGFVLSSFIRQTWRHRSSSLSTRTALGSVAAFKSLNLPGFAHHVIAARVAAGIADSRAISNLSVGGISGSSLELVPGYAIGDAARTFGVRGFSPSAERGTRAFSGSLEYRAPLAAPGRGIGWLPLFLDRVSTTVFADAGRAYCPRSAVTTAEACSRADVGNPWIASLGAELNLDTGLQRDIPFRLRAGVAQPIAQTIYKSKRPGFYITAGTSF